MIIAKRDCAFWWAGQCNRCVDCCRYSTIEVVPPTPGSTENRYRHGLEMEEERVPSAGVKFLERGTPRVRE